MKQGDCVRMKPGSKLRPLLKDAADAVGWIGRIDDEAKVIWVNYPEQIFAGGLAAEEFDIVDFVPFKDAYDP